MILVRPVVPADDAALTGIDLATWTPRTSPAPPPDPSGYRFLAAHAQGESVLVAEIAGRVVGYIAARPPSLHGFEAHVTRLCGLAVHPRHQRCGVGRALLTAAVDEARRGGSRKVALRVLADNRGARNLYHACGFVVEGVLRAEFAVDGHHVDDVLMASHIEPSATNPVHGVRAVMVFTPDPQAAATWWSKVLEAGAVRIEPGPGAVFACLDVGGVELGFHPADDERNPRGGSPVVYLATHDFDATRTRLLDAGAVPHRGPLSVSKHRRICQVVDPFGTVIGIDGP